MANRYRLIDTTLREGEQTPGVKFSLDEKKHIIDGLAAAGIAEIEIGLATVLAECSRELARYCREYYPRLQISVWSRCRPEDIDHAALIRPDIVSLSIPVSDLHLITKLGKNRAWARRTLTESVERAHERGLAVSVGFEDATRADTGFLIEMAERAEQAGAVRVRLADTVGICSPIQTGELTRLVSGALAEAEVGIHTHNDFGMASANAITALESGATWADGTVLGLGERTGCARLEEMAGFLQLRCGCPHLDISALTRLAGDIASFTHREIPRNQPLTGADIFSCETGLHLQGLIADPRTYEPFSPETVGARRTLIFGAKVGRRALHYWLRESGQGEPVPEEISADQLRHFRHHLENRV